MPQDGSRSRTARDRRRRLYRCRANPLAKESTSSQPSTSRKCNALARSAHSHDEGARDSRGFGGRSAIIFATAAVSRSTDPIGTAQNAVERIIDITPLASYSPRCSRIILVRGCSMRDVITEGQLRRELDLVL